MIEINEKKEDKIISRILSTPPYAFDRDGKDFHFSYRDKSVKLIFSGFIYFFTTYLRADIGFTYNADIGFGKHLSKTFGGYFIEHFCFPVNTLKLPFSALPYSNTLKLDKIPSSAVVIKLEHDPEKSNLSSFVNGVVLASREIEFFLDNFVDSGNRLQDFYTPRYLKGVPKGYRKAPEIDKPVAYSRKLRR